MLNLYDVLGVSMSASSEQIEQAYRQNARFAQTLKERENQADISHAHLTLTNPSKKRQHDTWLKFEEVFINPKEVRIVNGVLFIIKLSANL